MTKNHSSKKKKVHRIPNQKKAPSPSRNDGRPRLPRRDEQEEQAPRRQGMDLGRFWCSSGECLRVND